MERESDVLIVGRGFCGTVLTTHLIKGPGKGRITVIDPADPEDFGPAYRTTCPAHLLNAPAVVMSGFANDPNHFVTWATERGEALEPGSVARRALYREYLKSIWQSTVDNPRIESIRDSVEALHRSGSGWIATLSSGRSVSASKVVLAFGVAAPKVLDLGSEILIHPAYVSDLWADGKLNLPEDVGRVAIVGSGLTAIDAVLAIEGQGHTPKYSIVSRRGLLPKVHAPKPKTPPVPPEASSSISRLVHAFRKSVDEGADWRALIDAMRPNISHYWQTLTPEDRGRFLRHVRPYWEPHRHRMAAQIAERVEQLRSEGRIEVRSDRLVDVRPDGDALCIEYASGRIETVDLLINCAGPAALADWKSPLLTQLLGDGIVRADNLGQGLECSPEGLLAPRLYALGVLRKGMLWESTAVRELSVQAAELAEELKKDSIRQAANG